MIFPDQDSTNFPIGVKNNLQKIIDDEYSDKDFLRYHQFIVYNYMIKNAKCRGLLINHEMGMGKSISAVALAEYYREHDPDRKIIVLLSKSLQDNFKKNISKFIKEKIKTSVKSPDINPNISDADIDNIVDTKYKFVSLNASNMFQQMTQVKKSEDDIILEKQLNEFYEVVKVDDFLEKSLLIIDEFHNLSNAITNGSTNAMNLYDIIMRTKNIKLLFLTGTPIINDPFELVPTFNMLKGSIDDKTNKTLFPELQLDFDSYFIDAKKNIIKNADKFKNRILGLTSYYGNLYFGTKRKEGFPEELSLKVVYVPMSSSQFARYNTFRDLEVEENAIKKRASRSERFSSKSSVSSSYRVKSRQSSNYLIPEYALGPIRGMKSREKYIDKIKKSDLLNTDEFSPKFGRIIKNIKKHENQLGLVYSEFVTGEGLAILARILELNGYKSWNTEKNKNDEMDVFGLGDKEGGVKNHKTFAIISGEVNIDERENIVTIFNNKRNIHGNDIALLLISKTGAEGLDLKCVRHIHIVEPYWNASRQEQIIARGVRYLSHTDLPKSEQTVQTYLYLSDYPEGYNLKKKKEETTDVHLYTMSVKNKILINQFLIALAEASIDCSIHESSFDSTVRKNIKCKMCAVTNKKLYHSNIAKDMILPNPCEELTTEEISAKEIDIDGEKFYYSNGSKPNEFHIFRFNKEVSGYVPLHEHQYPHVEIMRKLLNFDE